MHGDQDWKRRVLKATLVAATAAALLLLKGPSAANASVSISSPSNGATVSGTITIKATVLNEWWAQLRVDGKPVGSGKPAGNVQFTLNTASYSNGTHSLQVLGYLQGAATNNTSWTIKVTVANESEASSSTAYFYTLPIDAALPSGSYCASHVAYKTEMVPANTVNNNTVPTTAELQQFARNGYTPNVYAGKWAFERVDGQYKGTTDMIIRWAACKWGIDEDVVRAQSFSEHWDWAQNRPGDKRYSQAQCSAGDVDLWNYQCSNCCWQSWSIWQTKVYDDWQTWPMILKATAFAADFRYADMRACMNGDQAGYFDNFPAFNGHTYRADLASGNVQTMLWGCIGAHYSGEWYDGNSSIGAIWYINLVKSSLAQKQWKKEWPNINWPD
jgi:autotransporter family porin